MDNKKEMPIVKESIKIRYKELAGGGKSIFLALWNGGNDKWEYEFLKLYLVPEKTRADKEKNAATLGLANAIRSKRVYELQNNQHGFSNTGIRSNANVIDYVKTLAEKKRIKAGGGERTSAMNYLSFARHIEVYSGAKTTFKQIDKKYCTGFIEYLKTAKNRNFKSNTTTIINENTAFEYVQKLKAVINSAISDEIMSNNPFDKIKPENLPKKHETEIPYLTIDEVKLLENTPFSHIKQAFLFSCYTGLRFSDIQGLTWGQLQKDNDGETFIKYTQKKTKKQEYLPIHKKALSLIPDKMDVKDTDKVFCLPGGCYVNVQLKEWAKLAGLKKRLTFHVARHTCATILLSLGAPIESISKVMGHSDIKTTQVYAKVVNKAQREAVNLFDKLN